MAQKRKKSEQTPIIDGDARPDMLIDPPREKKKVKAGRNSSESQPFTPERGKDINSLDDSKDALIS